MNNILTTILTINVLILIFSTLYINILYKDVVPDIPPVRAVIYLAIFTGICFVLKMLCLIVEC